MRTSKELFGSQKFCSARSWQLGDVLVKNVFVCEGVGMSVCLFVAGGCACVCVCMCLTPCACVWVYA